MDDESTSYFRQIVRDAINDLDKNTRSYCFSREQYDAINKEIPCIIERETDGIYYLLKTGSERHHVKRNGPGRPSKVVRRKNNSASVK